MPDFSVWLRFIGSYVEGEVFLTTSQTCEIPSERGSCQVHDRLGLIEDHHHLEVLRGTRPYSQLNSGLIRLVVVHGSQVRPSVVKS